MPRDRGQRDKLPERPLRETVFFGTEAKRLGVLFRQAGIRLRGTGPIQTRCLCGFWCRIIREHLKQQVFGIFNAASKIVAFSRPTFARVAHPYMERFRYGACSVVEQIGRCHLVARHRNHRVAHRLQRISTFGVARKGARRTMKCIAVVFHIEHRVGPE